MSVTAFHLNEVDTQRDQILVTADGLYLQIQDWVFPDWVFQRSCDS